MTAKKKLAALERSITLAEMGTGSKIIHCPYCNADLDFNLPLVHDETWRPPTCCADFALSAIAIMQRRDQQTLIDIADRIRENTGGRPVFN